MLLSIFGISARMNTGRDNHTCSKVLVPTLRVLTFCFFSAEFLCVDAWDCGPAVVIIKINFFVG